MTIEAIERNSEMVIGSLGSQVDFDFGFNKESVRYIDGFINRQRESENYTPEYGERLTNVIGSFLGECIINCYGGKWVESKYGWAVDFGENNMVFPFAKTAKQFQNGSGDSVFSFFDIIPDFFNKE